MTDMFDKHVTNLTVADCETMTVDEFARAIMELPDPYIYTEGCDTGIFSREEFKAICSLEGKGADYWDIHLTLLEAVKKGRLQVWDSDGNTLKIQEIVSACNATERHRYQIVDLPLPENQREAHPCEILLPVRRKLAINTLARPGKISHELDF